MANILIIVPYEFYPARFGGALRCFHLLKENAKYHKVFLLTIQPFKDFTANGQPAFPENVTILSTHHEKKIRTIFNLLPRRYADAINSRIIQKKLFKIGNQFLLNSYLILKKLFSSEKIDYVIYENMQCFGGLYPTIKKMSPLVRHLYDAHNVDSELWKAQVALTGNAELMQYHKSALSVESNFHNLFSLCFCCSEKDKEIFDKLNDNRANIVVIPNGVDTMEKPFDQNPGKNKIHNILFCGTLDYAPNKEGLEWFTELVFPIIRKVYPGITLTIIGKMDNKKDSYSEMRNREGIIFKGTVEDVRPFYNSSSISVVPLLNGSGTRLKILEAMSMGNPVVSTSVGAEGLQAVHGKDLLIADTENEFSEAVIELIQHPAKFNEIRVQARTLVEQQYDWKRIGERVNESLNQITLG